MDAVDASWNRPTVDELRAVNVGMLIYDKTFGKQSSPEKYRAELAAAGIPTAGIHEESGTEAFEGYDRGVRAARMADREWSPGVFVYYCAADTPDVSGQETAISDFFHGVQDTTREEGFGAYGPIRALRAAQNGSARCTKLWGVETWHPRAGNNGDPANVDLWRNEGVHLLQMVGPSPIGGTDFDLALKPDWANGSVPVPVFEDDDMLIRRTSDDKREAVNVGGFASFRSLAGLPADRFLALDDDEWDAYHVQVNASLAVPPKQSFVLDGKVARVSGKLTGTAS